MKKALYYGILVILLGVFCYSGYRIAHYYMEKNSSTEIMQQAAEWAVQMPEDSDVPPQVDFEALRDINPDVVAWLYCADSPLNYPVVQGEDNDYYLYRLLDGSENENGTLFMDYRCVGNYSGANTLIYGHNMRSGNMFGCLTEYKDPAYYEQHDHLYLVTPFGGYRVELLAGCVTDPDGEIYRHDPDEACIEEYMAQSTFAAKAQYDPAYGLLTLSTCSYEYENARYVLIGQLVPIE